MHKKENWDDLRFVLAVANVGSINAAAKKLGVNHATVLRRIAAFEERSGVEIFEKSPRGYRVFEDRLRLIDSLKEVEAAVSSAKRVAEGQLAAVHGNVRITSTDSLCMSLLPKALARIQTAEKGLSFELLSTNAQLDLARLRADITVRPVPELPSGLTGKVAGAMVFGLYEARDCKSETILGLRGPLANPNFDPWRPALPGLEDAVLGADSFVTLREMAALGLGRTILPIHLGDADDRLVPCDIDLPPLQVPIWVASHVDVAGVARIRVASDLLVKALRAAPEISRAVK